MVDWPGGFLLEGKLAIPVVVERHMSRPCSYDSSAEEATVIDVRISQRVFARQTDCLILHYRNFIQGHICLADRPVGLGFIVRMCSWPCA